MRLRTLLVLMLVPLCLGMAPRAPAAGGAGPARVPSAAQKVYPVAIRYRQQLDQQVRLSSPPSPAPARLRTTADTLPAQPVPAALPPPGVGTRLSLLERLQQ
jgi:hypothetical protein